MPEQRHQALRAELALLDRAIADHNTLFPKTSRWPKPPDSQGPGGSSKS
jgi:hypothetical protein